MSRFVEISPTSRNRVRGLPIKVLRPGDQQALLDKFAQVEAEIGQDTHRRFEQMARDLAALASQSGQKLN